VAAATSWADPAGEAGAQVASGLGSTWWQYLLLFLAVAASWAGVPVIGTAALGAAAVAASQRRLDLTAVIVVAVIAGEAGGLGGYAIGRRWGRRLLEHPGRHQARREKVRERGESLYARWGALAVFVTPAIVSGTAKMPPYRFAVWNLLDSLTWTVFGGSQRLRCGQARHRPSHRARHRHLGHRARRRDAGHCHRRAASPKAHCPVPRWRRRPAA
jgi:membrane protein DedA with SNARE-associated domain